MKAKKYSKPKIVCQNRNGLEGNLITLTIMPNAIIVMNTSATFIYNVE
ncbi:hypothetical protein [Clostridium felsineum]|nr:hypothetical protein [Clostridium felsineum]URZ03677.1 hypothetical protein CLAUR_037380 [Clostridium felsineum]